MSKFSLSVYSFTPPTLPDQPTDVPHSAVRSSLIASAAVAPATSPLCFTLSLPAARDTNPLYPATHLQLAYHYERTGDIFIPRFITSGELVKSAHEAEPNLYDVQVPPEEVPRVKVNQGETSTASVIIHAWRGEKLLGKWTAGEIERLGFVGLKSSDIALRRVEARAQRNKKD